MTLYKDYVDKDLETDRRSAGIFNVLRIFPEGFHVFIVSNYC